MSVVVSGRPAPSEAFWEGPRVVGKAALSLSAGLEAGLQVECSRIKAFVR